MIDAHVDYSFPGSAWERIGVEAPASRVHKLGIHFGEAEARLHGVSRQSLLTRLHRATKLALRVTSPGVALRTPRTFLAFRSGLWAVDLVVRRTS